MIKAKRLIMSGGIIYNDVEIYPYGESGGKFIPGLFERYQLHLKSNVVNAIINMNMIDAIQIRTQSVRNFMIPVRRIVLANQSSFGPAWIIPEGQYDELGIPFVFAYDYKNIEHCAFIADGWLYLTKDESVISVEY